MIHLASGARVEQVRVPLRRHEDLQTEEPRGGAGGGRRAGRLAQGEEALDLGYVSLYNITSVAPFRI